MVDRPNRPSRPEPPTEGNRLGLTRWRDLGVAAVVGAIGSWVMVRGTEAISGQPPQLPWAGPLVLWFVAALVGALAFTTWRRIQVRRERIESRRALTLLALGKASALGGAAIAGGYLILALLGLGHLAAVAPQQRLIRGLVASVAGVAIVVAGLALERACRVPDPPEEDDELATGGRVPG